MSALGSIYFKVDQLEKLLAKAKELGGKGVGLSFNIDDKTNQYGQNVSTHISQTKEQREAKEKKEYVANGSIVWTDGKIVVAEKVDRNAQPSSGGNWNGGSSSSNNNEDQLPF